MIVLCFGIDCKTETKKIVKKKGLNTQKQEGGHESHLLILIEI